MLIHIQLLPISFLHNTYLPTCNAVCFPKIFWLPMYKKRVSDKESRYFSRSLSRCSKALIWHEHVDKWMVKKCLESWVEWNKKMHRFWFAQYFLHYNIQSKGFSFQDCFAFKIYIYIYIYIRSIYIFFVMGHIFAAKRTFWVNKKNAPIKFSWINDARDAMSEKIAACVSIRE